MEQAREQVTVKWIADDPSQFIRGSIETISSASILAVNGVDVAAGLAGSALNVGDLLKVSRSAVVMPSDVDVQLREPRTKRPRLMEGKDT